MKKLYPYSFLVLVASVLLSVTLSAQETKVTITVEKDGKMVKDTTYAFDDADEADHAMKIIEVMSGDEAHMMKMHAEMDEVHGAHSNSYVFISEDGEKTRIKKMSGDSLIWISEGDHEGDCVKTKKITVMVSDGEEGEWEIISDDGEEIDIETIIHENADGDGEEVEVIVVKKKVKKGDLHEGHEHDQDYDVEVKVEKEVIKKKSKKQ